MTDEWGGIDKNIQGLVDSLNRVGFPTTGSCEGHEDYRTPAFWVKIGAEDLDGLLRKRMEKILEKFYKNRLVSPDVKIETENANYGFYIHNGGEAYKIWREGVKELAAKISKGEKPKEVPISEEDRKNKLSKLPNYQKEAKDFAIFLNNNKDI